MDKGSRIDSGGDVRAEGYWLILAYPNNPIIRIDSRGIDRVLADENHIVLAIGSTTPFVRVPDGPEAAALMATKLSRYTRSAPITPDIYEYSKSRLAMGAARSVERPIVYWGGDAVHVSHDRVYVGRLKFRVSDVNEYAVAGADLPLHGGLIPGAIAILSIAAALRPEDSENLAERIAAYEDSLRLAQ